MNGHPRCTEPEPRAEATHVEGAGASLLAAVLALVPEGVAVVNDAGEYVMVNQGFTRHFGWEQDDVVGQRLTAFLDAADRGDARDRHPALPAAGAEHEGRGRQRCANGGVVAVQVRSRTVAAGGHLYRVALLQPELPQAPRVVVAGRLQVVGLERVREQLGARWVAVAERVFATAEAVIRRSLDRLDAVSRCDDGFVVCFAGLSADEASFKAAALSAEITRRLVGEVAESAATAVGFAAEVPIPHGTARDAFDRVLMDRLASAQAQALAASRSLVEAAAAKAALRPEPVLHSTGRHSGAVLARLDDGVGGRLKHLAALGHTGQEPDLSAELLLLRLGLACAWAASAERTVIVPGPWSSLCRRRVLERVVRLFQGVPRPVRERVGLEVRGVPPDAPRSRLLELVSALTTLGRAPSVELPAPAASGLIEGVAQRLDLVTIHAGSLLLPGPARAEALVREMAAWRARLLVRAVDHEDQLTALYALGVPLVAGRALDGGDPKG